MSNVSPITSDTVRSVDSRTGITLIRGGNLVGTGLLQSIQDAYVNITQSGTGALILIFISLLTLAEYNGAEGPLEMITKALAAITTNTTKHHLVKVIAALLLKIFTFLMNNKDLFISVGWVWVPYFLKPSSKNAWTSGVLTAIVSFSTSLNVFEIFLIANFYFLWTALRSPTHKMVFLFCGVAMLLYAMEVDVHTKASVENKDQFKREAKFYNDEVYYNPNREGSFYRVPDYTPTPVIPVPTLEEYERRIAQNLPAPPPVVNPQPVVSQPIPSPVVNPQPVVSQPIPSIRPNLNKGLPKGSTQKPDPKP